MGRLSCALSLVALAVLTSAPGAAKGLRTQSSTLGSKFRFDLGAASIQGKPILARTLPTVTAALGRPDHRSIHKKHASIQYDKIEGHRSWSVRISFLRSAGRLRATSVAIASRRATEVLLGKILRLPPEQLQRKIAQGYAGTLRLDEPYRCRRAPVRCRGEFKSTSGNVKVAFGLLFPGVSSERYILLYA